MVHAVLRGIPFLLFLFYFNGSVLVLPRAGSEWSGGRELESFDVQAEFPFSM